ncbi:MAG TPA: bifunctional diaminohydroxyphosphoribosylaminopyrimidine deaminase/5-amino-6-(5-phosphoribosylamino)uracil reductase RibD [Aliiroseovarius sp.]|nr:bifunctional diaminohydroxyphosphoribosylaminopyrimidine deaminase/5-amino-6-(5-phosphoribosylamino)uracil reductase RibD [Aliiroseovarius sp.]
MKLALSLGRRGLGQVAPWPSVGCVIVRDGRIVGRGTSDPGTLRHAEIVALDQAGPLAAGASVFVTLEPCAHHGRTPPCADALVRAGVARVVCALQDPNPLVAGQGLERLRRAGITVDTGLMADQATRDHAGFLHTIVEKRPLLTLKLASSFDGRIATATGDSRWITGPEARRQVHLQRARHDAVLVGGGTARADDPMLDVRDLGIAAQPVRLVMSRGLDLPLTGRLAQTAGDIPVWLLHGPDADPALISAWEGLGATLISVPVLQGQLDPHAAMTALADRGLTRIFCEGGGQLSASLLRAGLVDRLIGFTAGLVLGGDALASFGALGLAKLSEAPRFQLAKVQVLGADVMHVWQADR